MPDGVLLHALKTAALSASDHYVELGMERNDRGSQARAAYGPRAYTLLLCMGASVCAARTLLKRHRSIPGHSIAEASAIFKKSSLKPRQEEKGLRYIRPK